MATTITQSEDEVTNRTVLRIEGEMRVSDVLLLEKIALEIKAEKATEIVLDLADLDFLDSDSAAVLKRLSKEHDFAIEGMEIFLQTAVDEAERSAT